MKSFHMYLYEYKERGLLIRIIELSKFSCFKYLQLNDIVVKCILRSLGGPADLITRERSSIGSTGVI